MLVVLWQMFVQNLAVCVGGERLGRLLAHLMDDYRFRRSGFPDLTLWNVDEKRVKVTREHFC